MPSITLMVKPVFTLILSTNGSRFTASRTALVATTTVSSLRIPHPLICSAKRFKILIQEMRVSLEIDPVVKTSRPILIETSLLSRILRCF